MANALNQVFSTGLTEIADKLVANETQYLADLTPFNGVAITDVENVIEKALPAVIRPIVHAAFSSDQASATQALTSGEKQAFDYIVKLIRDEAAKLAA